ncbi:PDR/VanB family oxidoreductase [Acinetobacter guillouiae]|uniref:PDR/VanB family oxidoreductase n=1 Tax=Acinetobacter guillouiae TaxID=106649 RepID=UPI002FD97842
MDVVIKEILPLTAHILGFELVKSDGQALPQFTAGSHIDVYLDNGLIRQYSLANCSSESDRYLIGVLNDANSRGGSKFIHDTFHVGQKLKISEPRNLFPITACTQKALLFAGGIGITPIFAMAHELKAKNIDFELHYFARDFEAVAFAEHLQEKFAGSVYFHLDDTPETQVSMPEILGQADAQKHLYVCGPNGFMDFIISSAQQAGWQDVQIHKEHFVAAANVEEGEEFVIEIKSTGQQIVVPEDLTVIQILEENDIFIPVSCEQGICGTCITKVLGGEPDHRDMFLSDQEKARNDQFLPCCSRAKSRKLVIDI